MATPKPWEEGTIPTSDEFTTWFLAQPRDEQAAIMAQLLNDARTAAACWQQDHGGIIATLESLEARYAELLQRDLALDVAMWRARAHRYRNAWRSARRGRRVLRGAWDEMARRAARHRDRQTIELYPAGTTEVDRSVGITLVHTTEAAEAAEVVEHGLATTYADYLVDETDASLKPSGYCVDSMVSGPADHARCEGRGHLGQPCQSS